MEPVPVLLAAERRRAEGDQEVERIMKMTTEQLIAECHKRGEEPAKVIEWVDSIISAAKVEAYRRRMKLYV